VRLDEGSDIAIHTDSGSLVEFHLRDHPHLNYGYAVTSHSSQGQTADRVLIHADTEESAHLINCRMAYVAVSRGRYDAQIYTNDKSELAQHLDRDVSHRTAIQAERKPDVGHKISPSSVGHDIVQEHGVAPQSPGHAAGEGQGQTVGE
jgi:ATP-dependent exoDNAse (exonuclease V) alpha subunit